MRITLLLLPVLFIISCNSNESSVAKKFDAVFDTLFKPGEPGGAVLIAKDGKILYEKGFGVADIGKKEPITTKTLLNVGSISKTFVAFSILQLAKENKLSLDDPVYKYFPEFKHNEIAKKVTLLNMLTHTSGLPDMRPILHDSIFYLTAKDDGNWAPIERADSLKFQPGEHFDYSNPCYNGLALIVEKVSGMKWQDYVKQKIMRPAGMATSTITDGPYPESGVAHGYDFDGKQYIEADYGETPTFAAAGNGGVWSSVEELWQYEQAIQKNVFLDSVWTKKSRTAVQFPNWKDTVPAYIGMCWFITKAADQPMIGHTGSQGGFRSDYVWLPDSNIFYVLLCNTPPKSLRAIREKVLKIALEKQ